MSMTVNISDTVNAFTATLTEQRTALVAELETLDQQRAGIVQQMGQIDRTLAALKAPAKVAATTATGTGRKMSEQGKANIKTALDARRARLAAEAEGKATEGVAVPEKGTEEEKVVVQEASVPTIKVTALEKDVLVGGILNNNFQDGSGGTSSIWVDQIIDNGSTKLVTAKQLSGVVASLSKKKLISTDGEGISLTETGLAVAKAVANVTA